VSVALTVGLLASMPVSIVAETLTTEHVARIKTVGEAAVSPDGNLLAYVLNVPRNPFEEDNGEPWKQQRSKYDIRFTNNVAKVNHYVISKQNIYLQIPHQTSALFGPTNHYLMAHSYNLSYFGDYVYYKGDFRWSC
jgi:hypothetical protein